MFSSSFNMVDKWKSGYVKSLIEATGIKKNCKLSINCIKAETVAKVEVVKFSEVMNALRVHHREMGEPRRS